jgi:hypothetical protein
LNHKPGAKAPGFFAANPPRDRPLAAGVSRLKLSQKPGIKISKWIFRESELSFTAADEVLHQSVSL